jgi:hypothetical protein
MCRMKLLPSCTFFQPENKMRDIEKNIVRILEKNPGFSDKELASMVTGHSDSSRYINHTCRALVEKGVLSRNVREDGVIGNWLNLERADFLNDANSVDVNDRILKKNLEFFLKSRGWDSKISWGNTHGIDVEAKKANERWIIQVKGYESLNLLPVNIFVSVIGEVLQRMDDPQSKYSVALPDLEPFRRLWNRFPALSKERTLLTALFISFDGKVIELVN